MSEATCHLHVGRLLTLGHIFRVCVSVCMYVCNVPLCGCACWDVSACLRPFSCNDCATIGGRFTPHLSVGQWDKVWDQQRSLGCDASSQHCVLLLLGHRQRRPRRTAELLASHRVRCHGSMPHQPPRLPRSIPSSRARSTGRVSHGVMACERPIEDQYPSVHMAIPAAPSWDCSGR